jgi:hypothetical protein
LITTVPPALLQWFKMIISTYLSSAMGRVSIYMSRIKAQGT